ncbi:Syntaxin-6 [Cyphomyrmex costatus]|uniref:Syntaxin-6 n=1 Tax=Cyphomyrmex costatus TaxID=456900 RepID=A0A195D0P0_9HYME|nr:Syntaxin-6 [Cyphomyrmex costatus]
MVCWLGSTALVLHQFPQWKTLYRDSSKHRAANQYRGGHHCERRVVRCCAATRRNGALASAGVSQINSGAQRQRRNRSRRQTPRQTSQQRGYRVKAAETDCPRILAVGTEPDDGRRDRAPRVQLLVALSGEVCKALNKNRGLYGRWSELQNVAITSPTDELDWTTTELRKALRSIEWDLDDLEDTIYILFQFETFPHNIECFIVLNACVRIVEKNPTKFKIDNKELTVQRSFIEQAREEVKIMKDKLNLSRSRDRDSTARQPLLDNSPARVPANHGTTKYSKLENEIDSPNRQFLSDTMQQQNAMIRQQDEQLDMIGETVGTLKTVSRQINSELDEQAVMLDEFGNELETTDSKLDATMKKMAKVLHMSNGNYNNYIPAPTTPVTSSVTDLVSDNKPSSLSSLSTTIANCFLCSND